MGVASYLVFGGVVEGAEARERTAAAAALDSVQSALEERMRDLSPGPGIGIITRDEAGRPVGPFAPRGTSNVSPVIPLARPFAIAAAMDLERRGQALDAVLFFEHGMRKEGLALDPEAMLACARALSDAGYPERALDILDHQMPEPPELPSSPLPYRLCADMAAAQIALDRGDDRRPRACLRKLLEHRYLVSAAAAEPLVAWFRDALGDPLPEADLYLTLSRVFFRVERGWLGNDVLDGAWIDERDAGLLVVPLAEAERELDRVIAELEPREDYRIARGRVADAIQTRHLDPLGLTIAAQPTGRPLSVRLSLVARILLAAAAVTFLLGHGVGTHIRRRQETAIRERRELADTVAHELRTPLAALRLRAELLDRGIVPEDKRAGYVASIHDQACRLTELMEGILEYSEVEGPPSSKRLETVCIRRMLARGIRAARPALREARQTLEVDIPAGIPSLSGDESVLTRAVRNLLENAARYAPPGSVVTVRARLLGRRRIEITVADRGPGVPSDARRAIFEPFRRLRTPATLRVSGSGLGLALVRRAAQSHGGGVRVENRNGGGARFVLTLRRGRRRVA
jgi:signal transduction histidine kinase